MGTTKEREDLKAALAEAPRDQQGHRWYSDALKRSVTREGLDRDLAWPARPWPFPQPPRTGWIEDPDLLATAALLFTLERPARDIENIPPGRAHRLASR